MTAKPISKIRLNLQFSESVPVSGWPISRPRLRRLLQASLPAGCSSLEITVRVVDRREGRALNRQYRDRDYATNVLTFNYSGVPAIAADLVICAPVVMADAKRQNKPLDHHLAHLLVHGVLHAAGLDHDDDQEAEQMEALEIAILKRFRIPNPYLTGR